MTRRDRAALTLALEWARVTPGRGGGPLIAITEALHALVLGGDVAQHIAAAVGSCRDRRVAERASGTLSLPDRLWRRFLRARLALLLRALLRADAGDYGPMLAEPPWHPPYSRADREFLARAGKTTYATWSRDDDGSLICSGCGRPQTHARPRIHPLWEQAPLARGT